MSRGLRAATGAAFVELVVVLPVLVVLVVGCVDLARVFYYTIELTNAARAGAQYASHSPGNAQETALIEAAARAASPNITFTANASEPLCLCAQNDGAGQPWATIACTNNCVSGYHVVSQVTVTTRRDFSPISPFPGLPRTLRLVRSVTMRVPL
jgi:Flp pilus assembly protein TadG